MFIECYHKIHKDQEVQGFLNYDSCAELENVVAYNVSEVLEDNDIIYNDEIEYLCIYAHGSRVFGNPRKNSDIDFVLFYKGTIREDDLFNIFADENIYIEHIKCDFNPIEIDDETDIEYYIQKHDIEYHQKPVLEKKINLALALDDFDDDEQVQNIKSKQVQNRDYTKEYLDNTKELVDLGLPSGTLWFNYNYGVDHKKIYEYTKPKDFYGLYLSWGEKKIKLYYAWNTYAYCKYPQREKRKLAKYCNLDDYWALRSDKDDLTVLEPQDDIITHVYGPGYHIPTIDQYNELLQYTESFPVEDYLGIHRLDGKIFKSKINQNQIFFPFNGIKSGSIFLLPDAGWTECILQTSNISLNILVQYLIVLVGSSIILLTCSQL